MMRFCKNCGQELQEDVRFCPECGVDNEETLLLVEDEQEESWWTTKRKIIAWLWFIVIIVGVASGGYFYYNYQQQVMIEQQKAEEAREAAEEKARLEEKIKQEKEEKKKQEEEKLQIKEGINKALKVLETSEKDLQNLEDTIATGSYNRHYYEGIRDQIHNHIKNTKKSIDNFMPVNDRATKNDVLALLELQEKRLDMLYKVVSSVSRDAKEEFDAAQQLAERYQQKLKEFKNTYKK